MSANRSAASVVALRIRAARKIRTLLEPGRIAGAPAVSADRRHVAVPVEEAGRSKLYVMDADGSNARVVADSLELRGNPDWARDGRSMADCRPGADGWVCSRLCLEIGEEVGRVAR